VLLLHLLQRVVLKKTAVLDGVHTGRDSLFAARSPWQCAATFRVQACASLTMAFISSCVSCTLSTGSDNDNTPPDGMNLITSAPY